MRQCRFHHVKITIYVGMKGFMPVFNAQIFKVFNALLESCIIYQKVDLASFLRSLFTYAFTKIKIGYISGQDVDVQIGFFFYFFLKHLRIRNITLKAGNGDMGTLFCK